MIQENTGPREHAPHHVVIIGGGFGGLYAAQSLGNKPVEVTLVDKRNFHLFQPLLYQVATGSLSSEEIAASLRATLRRYKNIRVLLGEVVDIDPAEHKVVLTDGELSYDTLIVATGVTIKSSSGPQRGFSEKPEQAAATTPRTPTTGPPVQPSPPARISSASRR